MIEIVGVLDDGTRPVSDTVPRDPRWALELQQGVTTIIRVVLKNRAGADLRLTGSEHLVLTARAQSPQTKRLFVKSSSAAAKKPANVYDIVIAAEDTQALEITRGVYDIFAVRTSGRYAVVPASQLVIARSIADVANLP